MPVFETSDMNGQFQLIGLSLALIFLTAGEFPEQQLPAQTATQKQNGSPQNFGQSYSTLRPEQRKLVDDFVRRYNEDTGSKATPAQAYDDARMSLRTTFDAVTHALLTTKMSNEKGQSLGHR